MVFQVKGFWKHLLVELVGVILLSIGGAGIMKVGLGNSAYDAFSMSISLLTKLEVGTVATIINLSCVVFQMILLKRDYKPLYALQILVVLLIGYVVNLFYYHIFAALEPASYGQAVGWFLFFVFVDIIGVSLVVASGMIGIALESACIVFAKKYKFRFTSIRYLVDFFFFVVVFLLWSLFKIPLTLREGTIFLMLVFSPSVGAIVHWFRPILHKWIQEESAV